MGYEYLPPGQCLAKRGKKNEVLLKDELIAVLKERRFEHKGRPYPLSTNAIDQIVRELSSPGLNEGLLTANEGIYDKLTLGITVTEFIDGKKVQPTIALIDWRPGHAGCNRFHVTEDMKIFNAGSTGTRCPDIVCFVNGIPLVVIEAGERDARNPHKDLIAEGISRQIQNQKNDEIPHLYAYAQLLFALDGRGGRYATTKTPARFWAIWLEEDGMDGRAAWIKDKAPLLESGEQAKPHGERPGRAGCQAPASVPDRSTDQEQLLVSLLNPERLLEFIRYFILFDRNKGKLAARSPQVFGVKRLLERISQFTPKGARKGGVLWHTTGSGKSFTMVFLCKTLLMHQALRACRMLVVTDRIDLENQLSGTFRTGGAFGGAIADKKTGANARVRSGKDLAKRIGQGNERILFSIINKFNTASKLPACRNPSPDIIVLVDEGHRGQGGENHERMRKALPNAAYIAFTGTPLLKDEKTTHKFGPILHSYPMQRAVADGTVTPLLYEERRPELAIDKQGVDHWFNHITHGLGETSKTEIKKRFALTGAVYSSENRIKRIAWDISTHFHQHIKAIGQGLKGQLAVGSKQTAIRYKKYLDEIGMVGSAVVISPPDSREGHTGTDESRLPEVRRWWQENVGNRGVADYTQSIITAFASDSWPDILIVVDRLLTGFDEPRNTVLYIDKPLKKHNLIQAIARVNRLHEAKPYGLLIDYRGILKELDTAIREYQDLETRTQGGYEITDITELYRTIDTEYKHLPMRHTKLLSLFEGIENRQDPDQYRKALLPRWVQGEAGESYDSHQNRREAFYHALRNFECCLKTALGSRRFYEASAFSETLIRTYKEDLRTFTALRREMVSRARDIDSPYNQRLKNLVDHEVKNVSIEKSGRAYLVHHLGHADDPGDQSHDSIRQETDMIRSRIKHAIDRELDTDPYARMVFSELLQQAITTAEAMFNHPQKQYALFKTLEDKLTNRELDQVPGVFGNNRRARAFYGVFGLVLGDAAFKKITYGEKQAYVNEAIAIDTVVTTAMAEHSLNPQNRDAEIRKSVLPRLYQRLGMDRARAVIDHILHIIHLGEKKR